jgi:hypothetical protein
MKSRLASKGHKLEVREGRLFGLDLLFEGFLRPRTDGGGDVTAANTVPT